MLWLYANGVPKSHRRVDGLGSTLKPAYEPILLARKPMEGTTLDANLARHGTGALQIDAGRVPRHEGGRGFWPANVALTHGSRCRPGRCQADCPVALIDRRASPGREISRLFFAARPAAGSVRPAARSWRCVRCRSTRVGEAWRAAGAQHASDGQAAQLMRWLTRLLCPPGGTVLDPFAGSGSTGAACMLRPGGSSGRTGGELCAGRTGADRALVRGGQEMRGNAGAGWLHGVHNDHGENRRRRRARRNPIQSNKTEVLGNDQGTRSLREGRGNDCLGRGQEG